MIPMHLWFIRMLCNKNIKFTVDYGFPVNKP